MASASQANHVSDNHALTYCGLTGLRFAVTAPGAVGRRRIVTEAFSEAFAHKQAKGHKDARVYVRSGEGWYESGDLPKQNAVEDGDAALVSSLVDDDD